ncbi:GGDEF domain-containing protein [Lysobacter fragariae]
MQSSGATTATPPAPNTQVATDPTLDDARRDLVQARGGDPDVLAAALQHLAGVLDERGRTAEALVPLQELITLADANDDERLGQHAATQLATASDKLGDSAGATFWRQRADAYRDRFTSRLLQVRPLEGASTQAASTAPVGNNPSPSNTATVASSAGPATESLPRWPWLIAALCSVLGFAWWRTRQHAAELAAEAEHLLRTQQRTHTINTRLQAESDQLRRQAVQDTLTGALTRQAFASGLKDLLQHASHYGRPVALLVLDLDHFKQINDQHGHLAGDGALKMVVGVARENLTSGDLLGRFGGDEFLVAAIDHDVPLARELGESIRRAVAQQANEQSTLAQLGVSIGIAHATPDAGYDLEHLFRRADAALYAAKRAGRNRVAIESDNDATPPDQPALRQLTSSEDSNAAGTATV